MSDEYRSLKKQHYLNLIQECTQSGKNKRKWCAENGVKYSTLMRWQSLLRDELAGQIMERQAIVPVTIAPPPVIAKAEQSSEPKIHEDICIETGSLAIRFPASVPTDYLLTVIRGLRE